MQPLARELASGKVSDREGMHYFLASTLLVLVQVQYALWWGPRSGWLFHFEYVVLAILAWAGCYYCWKANNGREFVLRAICLSVPAGVRVFLLSLVVGLTLSFNAAHIFDYLTFRDPNRAYQLFSYAAFVGFSIYYWVLLYRGMAAVRILQESSDGSEQMLKGFDPQVHGGEVMADKPRGAEFR